MKKLLFVLTFTVFLPAIAVPKAHAAALFVNGSDQQGNAVLSDQTNSDAFVTGNSVSVTGPVDGELFAGGNVVSITKPVGRSVYAAGNVVTLDQGSGYNAFVAGNTVTLSGTYGHDVYAAGNTVTVKEGTIINGDLRIAGSVVSINGTVKGDVNVSGGQVTSRGAVGGGFSGTGGTLTFLGGSIAGDLDYQSAKTATGLEKVAVTGKTVRTDPPQPARTDSYARVLGWLAALLSTFVLGAFLILLVPKLVERQPDETWAAWSGRAAVGGILLVVIPIGIVVAFVTVIGWKVGLLLLALYVIGLLISYVLAAVTLGRMLFRRFGKGQSPWLNLMAGLVAVFLLSSVPWIGWLASVSFFVALVVPSFGYLVSGLRRGNLT